MHISSGGYPASVCVANASLSNGYGDLQIFFSTITMGVMLDKRTPVPGSSGSGDDSVPGEPPSMCPSLHSWSIVGTHGSRMVVDGTKKTKCPLAPP